MKKLLGWLALAIAAMWVIKNPPGPPPWLSRSATPCPPSPPPSNPRTAIARRRHSRHAPPPRRHRPGRANMTARRITEQAADRPPAAAG